MRIGIDCRIYGATGGYMGKFIEHLINSLLLMKHEDEYVLFFHEQEFIDFSAIHPQIHSVKTAIKTGSITEQILFPYELYREKLDIVFSITSNIPFLYRKKTIVLLFDLASYFYPTKIFKSTWMRNWSNFILRQSLAGAHEVIVLSETLKRDIIEIFDIHEDVIRVVPPMFMGFLGKKKNVSGEAKNFLALENIHEKYLLIEGDLREYKNIPRLLQAYGQLVKEECIDADLVFIGKEDPDYHEIRSEIIELGLQGRVHIYNVLDEEKRFLFQKNATLCVVPSLYEGSEQAILWALANNTPIISSLLPSILTTLDKDEAIFFRPMNVLDIKEALKNSGKNPPMSYKKRDMSIYDSLNVSKNIFDIITYCPTK